MRARLVNGRVVGLPPGLEEGAEVVVVVSDQGTDPHPILRGPAGEARTVVSNGEVDLAFPFTVIDVVGVYEALQFDFGASALDLQSATNHVGQGTAFDASTSRVTGLDAALADATQVVVLLRVAKPGGGVRLLPLSMRPGGRLPLVSNQTAVALHLEHQTAALHAVYRGDEFQDALPTDRQPGPSYVTPSLTTFDASRRTIRHLHAPLTDGDRVAVSFEDGGAHTVDTVPGRYTFTDQLLAVRRETRVAYRVCTVARVRLGPGEADSVEVPSVPSAPARASVFTSMPPAPPLWVRAVWWDASTAEPAVPQTEPSGIRLEWQQPSAPPWPVIVERREAPEGPWIRASESLAGGNAASFTFLDTAAESTLPHEYRLHAVGSGDAWGTSALLTVPRFEELLP
jgi:hypothetical protein